MLQQLQKAVEKKNKKKQKQNGCARDRSGTTIVVVAVVPGFDLRFLAGEYETN